MYQSEGKPLLLSTAHLIQQKVLRDIAIPANVKDVIAELRDQVVGAEVVLSTLSLQAIGEVAARIPAVSAYVLATILELVTLGVDYITNYCMLVLRDFLRMYLSSIYPPLLLLHARYPDHAPQVLAHVSGLVSTTEDSEAKVRHKYERQAAYDL